LFEPPLDCGMKLKGRLQSWATPSRHFNLRQPSRDCRPKMSNPDDRFGRIAALANNGL
jgi:hypothetical protein